MKVRVKGDHSDFTDHLDGKILTIVKTEDTDHDLCDDSIIANDGYDDWYIYIKNIVEVIE